MTADALHTQYDHGGLYDQVAAQHYVAVVKEEPSGAVWPRSGRCPGGTSRSGTTLATTPTTATRSAGSRSPRSAASTTPAPARRSRSYGGDAT
ncbi:hypothetical protein ACRAWF_27430 [Streptomyces sp. L7]